MENHHKRKQLDAVQCGSNKRMKSRDFRGTYLELLPFDILSEIFFINEWNETLRKIRNYLVKDIKDRTREIAELIDKLTEEDSKYSVLDLAHCELVKYEVSHYLSWYGCDESDIPLIRKNWRIKKTSK